jgi:hypothetical protein
MFIKIRIRGILITLGFVISNSLFAAGQGGPEAEALIKDLENIHIVEQAGDINDLEKVSDELEKKWFSKDSQQYANIMGGIASAFGASQFGETGIELKGKYARRALDKLNNLGEGKKIPLDMEFGLLKQILGSLHGDSNHLQDLSKRKDWIEKRREVLKYYIHGWERLDQTIDPNWDPNDVSQNVGPPRPPAGYRGPFASGMSPERIEDPEIRAEYEAALKEYLEKSHKRNEQYGLRRIKEYDLPRIQISILNLYSGPIFEAKNLEIEALEKDIARYVTDEKIRTMMLNGMKNRLAEASNQKAEQNWHTFPEPARPPNKQ